MSSLPSEHEAAGRPGACPISPRHGVGVCRRCFDFIAQSDGLCANCTHQPNNLSAFTPISYCVGGEQLHRTIATYKRAADPSVPVAVNQLTGLLSVFAEHHQDCLARAAGVGDFDLVTTVPSGSAHPARDNHHPLRDLVGAVSTLQTRYQRVLYPGLHRGSRRVYDPLRYFAFADLTATRVLLVDDLWTTGSSAQSAAAALRAAGAPVVAVLAIGRHLNRSWADNDRRLRWLEENGEPLLCPHCADQPKAVVATGRQQPPIAC